MHISELERQKEEAIREVEAKKDGSHLQAMNMDMDCDLPLNVNEG